MNDPKCKRYHRKCEHFSICVNIGEKGYVLAEHPNERYSMFYYPIYGKGKFGKLYDSNYQVLEPKKILDIQNYLNDSVVFEAMEDFHLLGFNTLDKSIKWGHLLLLEDIKTLCLKTQINFILCLNGKIKVNNKEIKRYDYAQLSKDVEYTIEYENNSEACVFYQL